MIGNTIARMARKQDSSEVATEKALAMAKYESGRGLKPVVFPNVLFGREQGSGLQVADL